jgi:hypothetical protein
MVKSRDGSTSNCEEETNIFVASNLEPRTSLLGLLRPVFSLQPSALSLLRLLVLRSNLEP